MLATGMNVPFRAYLWRMLMKTTRTEVQSVPLIFCIPHKPPTSCYKRRVFRTTAAAEPLTTSSLITPYAYQPRTEKMRRRQMYIQDRSWNTLKNFLSPFRRKKYPHLHLWFEGYGRWHDEAISLLKEHVN